jgi:hypothetical protein
MELEELTRKDRTRLSVQEARDSVDGGWSIFILRCSFVMVRLPAVAVSKQAALRVDEIADKRVGRFLKEIAKRALLEHPASTEQDKVVAKERGFGEVVRHQDDRFAERLKDSAKVALEIGPDERVEGSQGFIEQKHRRVEHQAAHESHTLALPAGELDRIAIEPIVRKLSQVGQFTNAPLDAFSLPAQMPGHQLNIAPGRQVRK